MSATMSISSSRSRKAMGFPPRFYVHPIPDNAQKVSPGRLFSYIPARLSLSLSFILAITIRVYIFSWCPATQKQQENNGDKKSKFLYFYFK